MNQDLRPIHYEEVQPVLKGNRLEVFRALQQHGPMTGSELALAMNWPPTSVLPRVSELYKQGWAQAEIAREVGRHKSTIHYWQKRNGGSLQ